MKTGFKNKKAFDGLEILELRFMAPEPVVVTMAPKYFEELSRGIRGPGALGGGGEQIGHLHCPSKIYAKCKYRTELTLSTIHVSKLRFSPTLRMWICKQ